MERAYAPLHHLEHRRHVKHIKGRGGRKRAYVRLFGIAGEKGFELTGSINYRDNCGPRVLTSLASIVGISRNYI